MKVYYATGRRKTSKARVFLKPGSGKIRINGKSADKYLISKSKEIEMKKPLLITGQAEALDLFVTVKGGGTTGQAEAIRHGMAKALVEYSADHKSVLKKEGLLTRDSRMVERKKPGRHKARKSTQFTKR